jgi:lipoyl(octanoyl) transferase
MSPVETPMSVRVQTLELLSLGLQEYGSVLALQEKIHQEVVSGVRPATLILVEHKPVFTAGKRTEVHERPLIARPERTPVIDVDRGGKITWHGPGQLVGYPILKLRKPEELVGYVRELETGIIELLHDVGLTGGRVAGKSGVWIEEKRKIAAIGIRVAKGVTMHGFAINANCSLEPFDEIVPCGIPDSEVTSISRELASEVTIANLIPIIERRVRPILESLI